MNSNERALSIGFTARGLAQAILKGDLPEDALRALPAQSLYLALKSHGLSASPEAIEMASFEQRRLMLDFDVWDKDTIDESNLWEWLSLPDATGEERDDGLKLLQKIVRSIDLKLIATLIAKYATVRVFDEPTDNPPGAGFYTPDKGHTWIHVTIADTYKHFLLARLLALIFETDAGMFYQLLSVPNVATIGMLQEEAYQERCKRLSAEGVPDTDYAFELNQPLSEGTASKLLSEEQPTPVIENIVAIEPLIEEQGFVAPLSNLLPELRDIDAFDAELTLLMNAALVRFGIPFHAHERVLRLVAQVKGSINIGLEVCQELSPKPLRDIYQCLGLQKLYRVGLSKLLELHKAAHRLSEQSLQELLHEAPLHQVFLGARRLPPEVPVFFDSSLWRAERKLTDKYQIEGEFRAIAHLEEQRALLEMLTAHS